MHVEEHPSPLIAFPSSHRSWIATPSPQIYTQEPDPESLKPVTEEQFWHKVWELDKI